MKNNNNKKIILGLIVLTIIFTMMGSSLAYLSWVSSEGQKTNITFATGVDFSCSADGGGNITENDAILVPTEVNNMTTSNYIKREIKVTPTITGKDRSILMNLWLDINNLGSGLSTSENVKYVLTTSSTSNTTGVVTTGTFHGKQVNEKIELLSNEVYNRTTTNTYYLWIWIDAAQTTLETAGQKINLSLNGTCSMTPSIVSNTVSNINNHNNDTVEVVLSNPNDYDIGAMVSYEDEILKDNITVPAVTEEMVVEVPVTEKVIRKAAAKNTNYLTVTVFDQGKETKYNTNAAFTKTVHYLHAGWYEANNFLGQTFDKSTIKSITFVDNNNVPNDAVGSMDVSNEGNGSIMAWYYKANNYTEDNKLYDFFIGSSNGIVYSGPDSSRIFMGLTNMVEVDLTYLDTSNSTTLRALFYNCLKLTSLDLSNFDTSKVTDMWGMFYGCQSLKKVNLSSFNTAKVENMSAMFYECNSLSELDLSSFNTQKVISMNSVFYHCNNLVKLNLSTFDTSKVTDMNSMFKGCNSLTTLDLSNFNTAKVTGMWEMFGGCSLLKEIDLSSFNTSNVTDMSQMFSGCNALTTLDLSNFDTSKVTNMRNMFAYCNNLQELNLSNFNTTNVTNMIAMFTRCSNLTTLDLSNFKTPNLTEANSMFSGCSNLEMLNLKNINTSKVTNLSYIFQSCPKLTKLNIKSFDFSNISNITSMFYNEPVDIEITVGNNAAKEWLNINFSSYKNIIIDNK